MCMSMCAHKEEHDNARVRNTYLCDRYILLRVQDACPTTRALHTRAHRHATVETSQWPSDAVFRKRAYGAVTCFRVVSQNAGRHARQLSSTLLLPSQDTGLGTAQKASRNGPHAASACQTFTTGTRESVRNCTAADQRLTDRTASGAPSVRQHISVRRYPTCPAVLGGPASAKPLARRPRAVSQNAGRHAQQLSSPLLCPSQDKGLGTAQKSVQKWSACRQRW